MLRVFLSCASGQFKECRDALASDLRAIGCEVKVQEDFQQGPRTLIERLEEYVAQCDRVVALAGDAYGYEASGDTVPAVDPPRSYTQWEYFFALGERLDGSRSTPKDLYLYFASESFLSEHAVPQSAEQAARQQAFVKRLKASGKHYGSFDSVDQLCRLVLRDGWRMTERPRKPRNLPYDSLGTLFKGREGFLDELHGRLRREPTHAAAIVSPQAIHGLGGVGKTRLAIEYALRHEAEYCALLFVMAETPEALRRNLATLCEPLVLDLPEREAREEEVRVTAALRWLSEHSRWLLVFDNVDTPPAAAEVEGLLARLQGGHVLVTSRLSNWSASVEALELDVLAEDDAVAFLLERTNGRRQATPTDAADARALARELGGLALALEQAGAFIAKLRVSLPDYLRRWRERETKVREWHDETLMKYPRSVAVTWDTSVSQLEAPALALLRMLCWLAPEPLPRAVLETDAAKAALAEGVERLRASGDRLHADPARADVEDALAGLAGFSLLKWESGNTAFRIHRLVEEVTRQRLPADQREAWLAAALGLMEAYLPGDPPPWDVRSWPRWEPVRAHVAAVVAAADAAGLAHPPSRLMNALGSLLYAKCIWGEAEPLYRRALAIDEASYGPDHSNVAIRLNNLAQLLQATNRLAEVEPLMRRALAIDEASYGADHPNVARDINNLATLLQITNRLAEAEPLVRRVVEIVEKSHGPDHPHVATALNNLAQLLKATNRLAEAEPLVRRALAIDEASYGPDHPDVATDINNLAMLLKAMNRLAEAEPLMRRALAIDEASYGPEHPHVAIRLNNLAQLLQATNRVAEAEPLMRRAAESLEKSLGADHPDVASALNNLAQLLQATNRLAEAEPLMRRALGIDEASYGPDHPDVARDLNNLALLLYATNRLAEAELLIRRVVEILLAFTQATGHEHPHLRAARANYARLLQEMGRTPDEVQAELDALAARFGVKLGDS